MNRGQTAGAALGLVSVIAMALHGAAFAAGGRNARTASQTGPKQSGGTEQRSDRSEAGTKPADDTITTLSQVTVTARLRRESLQSVPVAVDVFSGQNIQDAGIGRPNDFISLSPNVSLTESQDAGTSFLTIRGISQVRNGEPSVALIIDGVAQASPSVITQDLFDISEIQVLKGPQGALYGRNSLGGAIIITTKQPTNTTEGWVRVGVGNGGYEKAQAAVSGAIINDTLLYRIAGSAISQTGFLEDVYLQRKADPLQDQSAHGMLKWLPADNVTVVLQGGITHTAGGALNFVIDSNPPFTTNPGDANNTTVPITAKYLGTQARDLKDLALKIDVDSALGTLSSVTAYTYDYLRSAGESAPYDSMASAGAQDGFTANNNYSEELRLTSPTDQRVRYILGVYYLHTDREYQITDAAFNTSGVLISGIQTSGPDQTTVATWDKERRNAIAGFGNLDIDVTHHVELSAGLRYDEDRRKQTNVLPVVPTTIAGTVYTYPANPDFGQIQTATFSKWQPKLTATFRPSSHLTLYADYAQGFSSGGFNPVGLAALAATFGLEGLSNIYKPETTSTYELGVKSQLLDRRLALSGDVFKTYAKNLNFFSYFYQVNAQLISSMNVNMTGFEAEANFRASDYLSMFAGYGYTKSTIEAYSIDPAVVGNTAPYIPHDTYDAGVQYRAPAFATSNVFARLEYTVKGTQYWEPYDITARSPVTLVNARLGLESDEKGWTVTLWSRNLFNHIYNAEYVAGGFVQRGLPRQFGLDVQKSF